MMVKHENYTHLPHSNADSDLVVTNIEVLIRRKKKMLELIYKLIALEEESLIGKRILDG